MRLVNNNLMAMMQFKSGTKRPQPSEEVRAIQAKLTGGMEAKDLSKEEYAKLAQFEEADRVAFHAETNEIITKSEAVAMKIAKGEKLTPEEEAFINEKNPQLKREAEQAKKEGEELKKRLQGAKTDKERQSILMSASSSVASMSAKGQMSPIQARMKMEVIRQVQKEAEKEGHQTGTLNIMDAMDFEPGTFFDSKS